MGGTQDDTDRNRDGMGANEAVHAEFQWSPFCAVEHAIYAAQWLRLRRRMKAEVLIEIIRFSCICHTILKSTKYLYGVKYGGIKCVHRFYTKWQSSRMVENNALTVGI